MEIDNNQKTNPNSVPPEILPNQSIVNNQRGNVPIIIGVVLVLLIVGGGAYYLGTQKSQNSSQNTPQQTVPFPISTVTNDTQSDTSKSNPTQTPISNKKTYTNQSKGFSFEFPNTWQLNTITVAKGQQSREDGKYDISADDGEVEIVKLTKTPGWELRIEAQKEFQKDKCGGQGPETSDAGYKKLSVLGRTALRSRYEDGVIAFLGVDQPEPYPMPVMFKRLPGEGTQSWPNPDTGSNFVAMFCVTNTQKPLQLKITYYSSQFTQSNINSKTLDKTMLNEMDSVLESLKIL